MAVWTCAPCRLVVAAVAALGLAPCAHGLDYEVGEGKFTVTGSTYLGTAIRTDDRDPKLLANVNSALIGVAGNAVTPSAGRNGDDGNLNFDRGDPVMTVLKGYLVEFRSRGATTGSRSAARLRYDYATAADSSHPRGNAQNGYTGGSR